MAGFLFSSESVRRIGQVVRDAEQGRVLKQHGGMDANGGATPGVRLIIARHEGSSWPTGSTAVVTLYNGDVPDNVVSGMTMVAYNQYITFSSNTSCTARWVALGHNGFAWHPVDAQSDCGDCISLIGGVDFRVFPNYAHTNVQVLGHDGGGCVRWYDIFTCSTAASA